MTWTRRVDTRSGDYAHGITFVMHERSGVNVRAEVAVGSRKLHVDGVASLTLAAGQHRYGDELIAQLFTRTPYIVADRLSDEWTRVQVYLGPADDATADMLERLAQDIRAGRARHAHGPHPAHDGADGRDAHAS